MPIRVIFPHHHTSGRKPRRTLHYWTDVTKQKGFWLPQLLHSWMRTDPVSTKTGRVLANPGEVWDRWLNCVTLCGILSCSKVSARGSVSCVWWLKWLFEFKTYGTIFKQFEKLSSERWLVSLNFCDKEVFSAFNKRNTDSKVSWLSCVYSQKRSRRVSSVGYPLETGWEVRSSRRGSE